MKEQLETAYPAETLYLWTVTTPAKRLLGIAAARWLQLDEKRNGTGGRSSGKDNPQMKRE